MEFFIRAEDIQQFQFTFITDSDISNTISTQVEKNISKMIVPYYS